MAIIHYDMDIIKEQAEKIITIIKEDVTRTTGEEDPVVSIALMFYNTKVTQRLQIDHAHRAIVGGGFLTTVLISATKQQKK